VPCIAAPPARRAAARSDASTTSSRLAPAAFAAMDKHYQAALDMITAPETKQAFEIDQEPAALREFLAENFSNAAWGIPKLQILT